MVLRSDCNDEFLYILLAVDPDVPHVHHRSFLKEHVVFKEVRASEHPLPSIGKKEKKKKKKIKEVLLVEMLLFEGWAE